MGNKRCVLTWLNRFYSLRSFLSAIILFLGLNSAPAPIYFNGSYSQDFNTLAMSGSANQWLNDNASEPTLRGWTLYQPDRFHVFSTYKAGTGSANGSGFYSLGADNSNDRAFGSMYSPAASYFNTTLEFGGVAGYLAVALQNKSGQSYSGFAISFAGEQWRNGGNTDPQTMLMEYGFGDTFLTVQQWVTPAVNFQFTSPVHNSTSGGVDGNGAGRVAGLGGTINVTWNNDQTLWIRWTEVNNAGNDHGLAIDDFSITAVPEPVNVALATFGGVVGVVFLVRNKRLRSRIQRLRQAVTAWLDAA